MGGNGVRLQHTFPAGQVGLGKVAVNPFKGGGAVFGDLLQHALYIGGGHIVWRRSAQASLSSLLASIRLHQRPVAGPGVTNIRKEKCT